MNGCSKRSAASKTARLASPVSESWWARRASSWAASDTAGGSRAGQMAAVKRLLPSLAQDARYVDLFLGEADLAFAKGLHLAFWKDGKLQVPLGYGEPVMAAAGRIFDAILAIAPRPPA